MTDAPETTSRVEFRLLGVLRSRVGVVRVDKLDAQVAQRTDQFAYRRIPTS